MTKTRTSSRASQLILLIAGAAAVGCGANDMAQQTSPQNVFAGQNGGLAGRTGGIAGVSGGVAGQSGGIAGRGTAMGPMPGLGTMMLTPPSGSAGVPAVGAAGSPALGAAGASGTMANGGAAGQAGAGALAGSAGQAGGAVAGAAGSGAAGAAGSGMSGSAGAGSLPNGMDPTSVCMGGKAGMASGNSTSAGQGFFGGGDTRNFAYVQFDLPTNKIVRFQTILTAPKLPTQKSTLFIWPGLQHAGGSDPAAIGNGVLQPVLTWGPQCNPKAPSKGSDYMGWWISAMYVNISSAAAGPGGCAGGDAMDVAVGDRLYIDFAVKGTAWTQTVLNLSNMKTVDFTIDLKGQDQNWAIWDIEVPGYSTPAADTYYEKSVVTFANPVTSCQPNMSKSGSFSAPVLSPDGLNCCYDQIILKANQ